MKKEDKKEYIISLIFGLIMGISYSIGAEFIRTKDVFVMSYSRIILVAICLTIVFSIIIKFLLNNIEKIILKIEKFDKFKKIKIDENKKIFLLLFISGIILWIPAFLALYPGNYCYDGPGQISDFFANQFSAMNPILHTLILGFFFKLGEYIGSYSTGLCLYCSIQALLVIATFSYVSTFLIKKKVPKTIVLLGYLYLILNPIIQILSFSTIKDIIFSILFLLYIIYNVDMIENKEIFFKQKRYVIRYIITTIGMCLFRNQGIYIVIFSLPIIIITLKGNNWKKVLLMLATIITTIILIFNPLFSLLNVSPIKKKEMLSVPIQQLAFVYNKNNESIDEEERNILYQYIPEESLKKYIPEIVD